MGRKECEILSEDGGLKDIIQLLKEQSKKMERLGMALKVIQDGMRQNTPTTVKTSVVGQPLQHSRVSDEKWG